MNSPPRHILVVEDSAAVREMYASALSVDGFTVTAVANAKEAFRAVAKERFHLVILDLMLPGMNGFEVCKLLKKDVKTFSIPIIVASVLKGADPEVFAIESGADDFLFKPFDERVLRARVHMVLRRHEQHAALHPLTGLFGRIFVEQALEQRIQSSEPFAMLRFDLRHFRFFNRHYNYGEGDYFLKFVGAIVKEGSLAHGSPEDVVGHLSADDFVVITTPESEETVAEYVCSKYTELRNQYFDDDDVAHGMMRIKTRSGTPREEPLTTLHCAVVHNAYRSFENLFELFDTADEMLIFHKEKGATGWMRDRRQN